MNDDGFYTIRYASQRTGLTPHVIRAWEKRYQAVVPHRTQSNRRLYSEEDLQRLQLLKRATESGHMISRVAELGTDELLELARKDATVFNGLPPIRKKPSPHSVVGKYYQDGLTAVTNLDSEELKRTIERAAIDLSRPMLLRDLIVPLFKEIGHQWRSGSTKIINEHMATSVVRPFLLNLLRATAVSDSAPRIVIATAVGQWHDMGALAVALTAAECGWQPVYYGPNLPAEEIATAAKLNSANTVAVSVVHSPDHMILIDELRRLRRYIGESVALLIGGRAVGDHLHLPQDIDAKCLADIDQLVEELESVPTATVS